MKSSKMSTVLDFVSLQARDLAKSKQFYHEILGFQLAEYQNPEAVVFEDAQGAIFAIRKPLTDLSKVDKLGVGASLWFGWSEAIETLHDHLQRENVKIVAQPFDTPFGKSIVITDPDGYLLTFHETK